MLILMQLIFYLTAVKNECLLEGSDIVHSMHYIFQYICVYVSVFKFVYVGSSDSLDLQYA